MKKRTGLNLLNDQECLDIVKRKLSPDSSTEFSLLSYETIPLDSTYGFMGQYFILKATVTRSTEPQDTNIINFFAKLPPSSSTLLSEWNEEHRTFKKETDLYSNVFPALRGLDKCIPRCFLSLSDEIIILEDMQHRGFLMADKFVPFDLAHCRVVMKTMARFHARSLIFEELQGKSLQDEFEDCLHETLWPLADGRGRRMLHAAINGVTSLIDLLLDALDDGQRLKFKESFVNLTVDHADKLTPSKKYRNVICHGDLWANNMLFRYSNAGQASDCCFIDFQLARYNPPTHDILTFLYFTTMRKLREDHLFELLKTYYETLTACLADAGLNCAVVLPWQEILDSLEELQTMCMIHGILNATVMLLGSDAVVKYFQQGPEVLQSILYVDRTPMVCREFRQAKKYRERIRDTLLDIYDRIKI